MQEKALDDSDPSYLDGAELDAWYAPSLRGDMRTGLGTWSENDIVEFLKHGHNRIGTAFGSMTEAVNNSTSHLSDSDLGAIASYLKSMPATSPHQAVAYDSATTAKKRDSPQQNPAVLSTRALARAAAGSVGASSVYTARRTPWCSTIIRLRLSI
jgi:hypothetical protein